MDTIYEEGSIDTSCSLFGQTFKYPVFAAPIMGTNIQYGEKYYYHDYNKAVINGCKDAGTLAFTFFDPNDEKALDEIIQAGGLGIPTVKPWPVDVMLRQFKEAEAKGIIAVRYRRVDGAGLSLVQGRFKSCRPESVKQRLNLISTDLKIPVLSKVL
jgi:hypothetical protein